MSEALNIANSILILGVLYFGYTYGFNIGHFLLIIWSLGLWAYHGFTGERKAYIKAQTRLLEAKALYYEAKSKRGR